MKNILLRTQKNERVWANILFSFLIHRQSEIASCKCQASTVQGFCLIVPLRDKGLLDGLYRFEFDGENLSQNLSTIKLE